ncbi:MAG: polyphosphate kinase 2 family protein [Gemmatimonadota bacterium]|nr:polyphosphate kinase 2 family protein [Gemmatimonadota bacterium]
MPFALRDEDALCDDAPGPRKLRSKLKKRLASLDKLQAKLYGDGRYAVLVVLQGRDAAGKDGSIRRVFSACNPQGCQVTSFKEPTVQERKHDFLWRIHQAVPARGMLGIFNRSQYEDVLAARVKGIVAKPIWMARYDQMNDFESMLVQNNVMVLKFFLHVSRGEQRRRLLARVETPDKNWKFREGDLEDRRHWDAYTEAYHDMLRRTSTRQAPWYLVPSDDKKVRDYLVAGVVVRAMRKLKLHYPEADPNILLKAEQVLTA